MMFCRVAAIVGLAAVLQVDPVGAQQNAATTAPSATAPAVGPAAAKAVEAPSLWDLSATLRASMGWRDNLLMSAVRPLNRTFWRLDGDALVLRPLGTHFDLIGFLSGDVLRYLSPPADVPGEQEWASELQLRWHARPWLTASLKGVGFLDDTFIDPSITEGSPEPVVGARAEGGYVMFIPQCKLPGGFTLEPSLQEKRIRFARFGSFPAYPGAHTESTPGVRLTWTRSAHLVLSAGWFEHTRHYSELTQSKVGSRPIPGRLLSLHQQEGELKAVTKFQAHGTWTLTSVVGRLENRDRAFGFLDYDERRGQMETQWSRGPWRVQLSAEAKKFDYRIQTVGTGISVTPRVTEAYETVGRVEHDFGPKWMAFAEDRWERNRSNVTDFRGFHPFSYRTDTVQIGLQRSF